MTVPASASNGDHAYGGADDCTVADIAIRCSNPALDCWHPEQKRQHIGWLLLNYCLANNCARIGFHGGGQQTSVLTALREAGYENCFQEGSRGFIRKVITYDREAFRACKPHILFQTVRQGAKIFWNGFGYRVDPESFFDKEIIIDVAPRAGHLFAEENHFK